MQWQQGRMAIVTATEAVSVVTVAATMAMAVADNKQKLRGQATINKMGQAAAVEAETVAVPAAIVAERLQWQVGAWWSLA